MNVAYITNAQFAILSLHVAGRKECGTSEGNEFVSSRVAGVAQKVEMKTSRVVIGRGPRKTAPLRHPACHRGSVKNAQISG